VNFVTGTNTVKLVAKEGLWGSAEIYIDYLEVNLVEAVTAIPNCS
jgi:hypothetical protein